MAEQQQRLARCGENVAVLTDAGRARSARRPGRHRSLLPSQRHGLPAKCRHYLAKIGELLWTIRRESNTEGGLFPAIFGTVMLMFLMAVTCFPLGVLAGIYLGEYAKEGLLVGWCGSP